MCTAVTLQTEGFYFGRTLDHEASYGEEVTFTPRRYPFSFRHGGELKEHYAILGMAHVREGFPLYYDAMNEKGLCIAGLNFVESARYGEPRQGWENLAQFELIPRLLGECADLREARALLARTRLVDTAFSPELPPARLHWLLADRTGALVIEPMEEGLRLYDDPAGVLTNEPPFPRQMDRLNDYMGLSPRPPENRFSAQLPLKACSRGMGALGLPGDLSSGSRFVRAAFVRANSVCGPGEEESVSQFFHILGAVEQQRGCCEAEPGRYEITLYASCCSAERGVYYYTTYGSRRIAAVDLHREDPEGEALVRYTPVTEEQIFFQN